MTNLTHGCKQHVAILHTTKMQQLANAYEEKLHVERENYEGGFNQVKDHVEKVHQQTLQGVQAAIENMRIETQKTAESLHAHALNAKNAEAIDVFDRQRAEALEMQQTVARLKASRWLSKRDRKM